VNQESFVFFGAQDLFKERAAGLPFSRNHAALASAGVDQKAQCERQVTLLRKITDSLRATIF
jgi:hypothetical protein